MDIIYRQIEKEDNQLLAKLIRQIFIEFKANHHQGTIFQDPTTDKLYELFQTQKSICWVAIDGNNIVGCCGIYPTKGLPKDCAELVKFYVSTESRGKGIGKMLLRKSINSAKELGYNFLYLESLPEFNGAVEMYQREGFKKLVKPMGASGHFGCDIWMLKRI